MFKIWLSPSRRAHSGNSLPHPPPARPQGFTRRRGTNNYDSSRFCQIPPDSSPPDSSRFLQIPPDSSRFFQIPPDSSPPDSSRFFQIPPDFSPDSSRFLRIPPDSSRFLQISLDSFRFFKISQVSSKCFPSGAAPAAPPGEGEA